MSLCPDNVFALCIIALWPACYNYIYAETNQRGVIMQCPYCKQDMEAGLIQSPREIAWIKGNKKRRTAARFHEGSVVLSAMDIETYFDGNAVRAYLCRDCRKVIIDY